MYGGGHTQLRREVGDDTCGGEEVNGDRQCRDVCPWGDVRQGEGGNDPPHLPYIVQLPTPLQLLGHCASTGDGDKRRTTTTRPESNARSPRENRPPKRDRQSQPMNAADSVRLIVVHLYPLLEGTTTVRRKKVMEW